MYTEPMCQERLIYCRGKCFGQSRGKGRQSHTGAAWEETMQHLQLATVMAAEMCLCMEGLSASPNFLC